MDKTTAGRSIDAARWLGLAAAPTFMLMALLTAAPEDGLCSAHSASPLGGMALMYGLMGMFHAGPWLKLMANRPFRRRWLSG